MKALFITTATSETNKHWESFTCLNGNTAALYTYQHRKAATVRGADLDHEIRRAALKEKPDLIVYIGACGGNTPSAQIFRRLRDEIAPTVHFCSDAADAPWWPFLEEFDRLGSFSVQVALDGNHAWPFSKTQITALTPIDPRYYAPVPAPHGKRRYTFGFAGNVGNRNIKHGVLIAVDPRREMVDEMIKFGLKVRQREGGHETYPQVAAFLGQCRMVPNFPHTGSREFMHVKGRVIETALAGALLLEQRGSPTKHWFTPGVDYLEYETAAEARSIVQRYANEPEVSQAIAGKLRARVMQEHGPAAFWGRIFDHIGLKEPVAA